MSEYSKSSYHLSPPSLDKSLFERFGNSITKLYRGFFKEIGFSEVNQSEETVCTLPILSSRTKCRLESVEHIPKFLGRNHPRESLNVSSDNQCVSCYFVRSTQGRHDYIIFANTRVF